MEVYLKIIILTWVQNFYYYQLYLIFFNLFFIEYMFDLYDQ
jgi:hypothetical protein